MQRSATRRIGILGAGWIGTSVGADLVLHGFSVVMVDIDLTQFSRARAGLREAFRFGPVLRPGLPRLNPDDALRLVRFSTDPADLAGCEFVIENVTESWEVKRDVYRELDAVLPQGIAIGVNTSSILISRIAGHTSRPDRIVGMHFMSPAYASSAVEVMRGGKTSDETIAYVRALVSDLGKEAIVVGDFPGFVSNRLSHLFFNEAARLVEEHDVAPDVVDQVFRKCFGHQMGPLETADLIGLDTVVLTLDRLEENCADGQRFHCCELLRTMVASGRLGRKSGEGFYRYGQA